MRRTLFSGAGSALLMVATAAPASAAPWEPKDATARSKLDEGRAAFKAEEYRKAGVLFTLSDEAEPNLNARWNAAQAFAAAGDWKRASALYDSLVADADLPKDRRPAIEQRRHLAARFVAADFAQAAEKWDDAREILMKLANDAAVGEKDRATAIAKLDALAQARAEAERAPIVEPTATDSKQPPPPQPVGAVAMHRPARTQDRVSLALIGVGVVGVGVGAGFLWNAGQLDDDANSEPNDQRARDLHDRADTRRTLGQVVAGVGAVALVAGVVKFAIPAAARPAASVASFRVVEGGGMLVLSGSMP